MAPLAGTCALAAPARRRLAITIDDFNWRVIPRFSPADAARGLLDTLEMHGRVRAALFVCGRFVDGGPQGRQLLRALNDAGHLIGNHTYSHPNYHSPQVTTASFEQELLRNEAVLGGYSHFRKWFRFPMLHEGDTKAKRDDMRAFLRARAYRNGHVTIDTSDWYYDFRLRSRLEKEPGFETARFRRPYLEHILDRARYYDGLSQQAVGRSIPHTLLIHYNYLNTLWLGDLLDQFAADGWDLIHADEAYGDEVFGREPRSLPAGESLVWALAKEAGKLPADARYPAEDGEYERSKLDALGL